MKSFFVSDVHYNHKNIIQYSNRPFVDVADMNEQLINNWNRMVSNDDIVYSLGDFAFCKIDDVIKLLNRLNYDKLIMVLGNHDKVISQNKQLLLTTLRQDGSPLVDEICTSKDVYINNQLIYMHHYGCRVWLNSHYGSWHLYGHSHGSLPPLGLSVDVGVDAPFVLEGKTEYRPYSFAEIKKFMDKQKIELSDYHSDQK